MSQPRVSKVFRGRGTLLPSRGGEVRTGRAGGGLGSLVTTAYCGLAALPLLAPGLLLLFAILQGYSEIVRRWAALRLSTFGAEHSHQK